MRRIGFFVFYDKEGIVDRYVEYLLQEMNKVLDQLVIVCNGTVQEEGKEKLQKFSKDIFVRENIGFDAGAYKYLLLNQGYIEKVKEYDELVIFNDTCYGPFFHMNDIFKKMDAENLDFWGMTQYEDQLVKKHIQSYFMVFHRNVIVSKEFYDFWDACNTNTTIVGSIISEFEMKLTNYLYTKGFRWGTYIDSERYYHLNPYFYFSDRLIIDDQFPFLKKRRFKYKTINQTMDKDLMFAMEYIKNDTEYPIDYIYENAIRVNDIFDLRETLNLNYVISEEKMERKASAYNAAVFIHLYYQELVGEAVSYIKNVPSYIDIYITSSEECVLQQVKSALNQIENRCVFISVKNQGRDVSALLIGMKKYVMQYQYVCFVHDKKTRGRVQAEDVRYLMWDNLLKSKDYVENVLDTLQENKYLGFLSTPFPYHGDLISVLSNGSGENKELVKKKLENAGKLMTQLGLPNRVNVNTRPIALSTAFWCKSEAIRQLFEYEFTYEDFPYSIRLPEDCLSYTIEIIFPFIAQANGFYSGQVENSQFAAMTLLNYEKIIRNVLSNEQVFSQYFLSLEHSPEKDVEAFYEENHLKKVYIYGTGLFGNSILQMLEGKKLAGFIVSDAYYRESQFKGLEIYRLSEITEDDETAIVVAMDRKNTEEVQGKLQQFKHVLYIW